MKLYRQTYKALLILLMIYLLSGCGKHRICVNGELWENDSVFPMWWDKTYVQYEYLKGRKCVELNPSQGEK